MRTILALIFASALAVSHAYNLDGKQYELTPLQVTDETTLLDMPYQANYIMHIGNDEFAVEVTNSLYIKVDPDKLPAILSYIAKHHEFTHHRIESLNDWYEVTLNTTPDNTLSICDSISKFDTQAYIEPALISAKAEGYTVTYDPHNSYQWHIYNSTYPGIDTNVINAWNYNTGFAEMDGEYDECVHIGIIDCAVDKLIPELINRLSSEELETTTDNPFSGYVNTPEVTHGTNIAGIIVAERHNNIGITGIVPNAKLRTCPINYSNATAADIAQGIIKLTDRHCSVINCSFSVIPSVLISDAITYATNKGTLIVAAAGDQSSTSILYPAKHSAVISVGAINKNGDKSSFSNYGDDVDIVAPGNLIFTTNPQGDFTYISGTSAAAACVTGCAALVKAHSPSLTPAQIKKILLETAQKDILPNTTWVQKTYGSFSSEYGYGLVDSHAAIIKSDTY